MVWTTKFQFPAGQGRYSYLCHYIQTGSGAHPVFCPIGTGGLSLGLKWPGHEAGHSCPSNAKVKDMWN